MEAFVHLRKGATPRRLHADLDCRGAGVGAAHDDAGPDQRDKLRAAVEIVSDWLVRHDFAAAA